MLFPLIIAILSCAICYYHHKLYASVEHDDKTKYCIAAIKSYLLEMPLDVEPQSYIKNKLRFEFTVLYDYFDNKELEDMIEFVLLDYEPNDCASEEVVSGSDTTE